MNHYGLVQHNFLPYLCNRNINFTIMNIKFLMALMILPITFASCSSGSGDEPTPDPDPQPPVVVKKAIKISTNVNNITRATDTGFDANDQAGLFVVNRGDGNTSVELKASGNHVNNMRFTYNGTWTPDSPIYWKDNDTHADFYFYFPYKSSITDVAAVPFSVNEDQSSESKYKASELLVGSKKDVSPTENNVNISVSHAFSQIQVVVAAGNGFTTESLAAANIGVTINGVKTSASVNIANAAVSATGDAKSIRPWLIDGIYKALIVPQTVEETNLITVNVDGRDFNLKKAFTFQGGKSHKFTVTVSKTSNGVNVDITKWETDDIDNGGVAE